MELAQIADVFEEIAQILELKGENVFKVRAYSNAARIIGGLKMPPEEFLAKVEEGEIRGIGKGLSEKIKILLEKGNLPYLDDLRKELPSGLCDLLRVPGLGPKKIKALYDLVGIKSVEELEKACKEGELLEVRGFGEKTTAKILEGISRVRSYAARFLFAEADETAKELIQHLRKSKLVDQLEVAGSLRRKNEVVGDIDLLATSKKPRKLMDLFTALPGVRSVAAHGETKSSIILRNGIGVDIRVVSEEEFPAALVYFTGSKAHNTIIRGIAQKKGLKLNEYGIFKGRRRLKVLSEKDIYSELGLSLIPPELREDQGEVECFRNVYGGEVSPPKLIEFSDIKGVLHVHTTYSDGKNTVEEMAQAVRAMGFQYLGITDHSRSAAYARGLSVDSVKRQMEEIDRLNIKLKPFHIFKGIESDILADGSLDYPDKVLELFDFVIASVHSRFGMTEREMTDRMLTAIRNPYTTILGHPTGRLLLKREAYAVDLYALLETAAKEGVAVELNCNPRRLDLDWRYHREAVKLGIPIPINPDAHMIAEVNDIRFGVGIARKGWLTAKEVLTAWSAKSFRTFLDRRRKRR